MSLFTETVTLRQRVKTGEDPTYGNDVYGNVDTESPAWLEQVNGTESTDGREQSTSNMRLFLPLGVRLASIDAVLWGGDEWQFFGEPGRQPGGFAVEGYQQVTIRRVTG